MAAHTGKTTTNHDTIRRWAERRGGHPACVKGTGGRSDPGMIRIDLPGYSGASSLQPISWDEWFQAFDDNGLALVYQDRTASGKRSNFNKLVSRETVRKRAAGQSGASVHHPHGKRKSSAGTKRTARTGASSRGGTSSSRGGTTSRTGSSSGTRTTSRAGSSSRTRTTTRTGTTRARSR
ncbi:MAG TPA: hypothetical protein VFS44_00370 [Gemmatimonadaceae bacterium]|nr:hypothetical protein [Gemmatimonadaceae bacterium]